MAEWLALGLVPILGMVFLYFSAWAEDSMLRDQEPQRERYVSISAWAEGKEHPEV
jgi:hypothetical protein